MEKNNTNYNTDRRILTLKDMQELLPDYVFGRLSVSDKNYFELSLPDYPEIREEINEVKAVFSRFERMDIDKIFESRTRNMSVKVNNRLENAKNRPVSNRLFKYIAPAFGMVFLLAVMLFPEKFSFMSNSGSVSSDSINKEYQVFSGIDDLKAQLGDSIKLYDISVDYADAMVHSCGINIPEESSEELETEISNICEEEIVNSIKNDKETRVFTNPISELDLMDQLNEIDESDFQIILKELKNAKISS
jgi:hypothetical protein